MQTSPERALSADTTRTTPVPPTSWFGSSSAAAPTSVSQAMALVVSSQPAIRAEFRAALTSRPGIRVVEASSVQDAVDLTREIAVHLAVADAGAAALTRDLPWLPTIFIASLDDVAPPVTGTRAQLLVRPLVPERLQAMVRLLVER